MVALTFIPMFLLANKYMVGLFCGCVTTTGLLRCKYALICASTYRVADAVTIMNGALVKATQLCKCSTKISSPTYIIIR